MIGWWSRRKKQTAPRPFRYESFGGIAQLQWPRALVFVDRTRARSLGHASSTLWSEPESPDAPISGLLSAPLEAHLQLTNRCKTGCQGCYTGATPSGARHEWDEAQWKRAIDELARAGVFHLALGGGESAALPWLPEIARYARERGLVPNLTTSGILDEADLARLCANAKLFGQINVSIDGIGEVYAQVRGVDGFAQADSAVRRLRRVTRSIGINCVVTRQNFAHLPEIFKYARQRRLNEVELLRFKPAGRGHQVYDSLRCTQEQHEALVPLVLALAKKFRLRVRLDCSYTPMVAFHNYTPEILSFLAVYGCVGGDFLIGGKASGALSACSFAEPSAAKVDELGEYWRKDETFAAFRAWRDAEEPCRGCAYLNLCRGGCRVVSDHVLGDLRAPDPECPKVVRARLAEPSGRSRRLPVLAST